MRSRASWRDLGGAGSRQSQGLDGARRVPGALRGAIRFRVIGVGRSERGLPRRRRRVRFHGQPDPGQGSGEHRSAWTPSDPRPRNVRAARDQRFPHGQRRCAPLVAQIAPPEHAPWPLCGVRIAQTFGLGRTSVSLQAQIMRPFCHVCWLAGGLDVARTMHSRAARDGSIR